MNRRDKTSRTTQRQEMLRELAAEEVVRIKAGPGLSRAAEAIDALQRIREGTYGTCADCSKTIPAARLHAKPEATRCIVCQIEYERRLASGSGDWHEAVRRSA